MLLPGLGTTVEDGACASLLHPKVIDPRRDIAVACEVLVVPCHHTFGTLKGQRVPCIILVSEAFVAFEALVHTDRFC